MGNDNDLTQERSAILRGKRYFRRIPLSTYVAWQLVGNGSKCYSSPSWRLHTMEQRQEDVLLLQETESRLRRLSPALLRVARDFLAYLEEREENEATQELLSLPGFEDAFHRAVQQAEAGEVVSFESIRRDV